MNHTFKVIGLICILLVLIIGTSLIAKNTLERSSKDLEGHVEKIEVSVREGKWETANTEYDIVQEKWLKTEKIWTILLDHFEIDNIDNTMLKMSKYIEAEDIPLSMAEAAALRQYIQHIPRKEKFDVRNIF